MVKMGTPEREMAIALEAELQTAAERDEKERIADLQKSRDLVERIARLEADQTQARQTIRELENRLQTERSLLIDQELRSEKFEAENRELRAKLTRAECGKPKEIPFGEQRECGACKLREKRGMGREFAELRKDRMRLDWILKNHHLIELKHFANREELDKAIRGSTA